MNFVVVEVSG